MIDEQWLEEAYSAARRANASDPRQIVQVMKAERVTISDMDEWCRQARLDYPCMYRVPGGIVWGGLEELSNAR